MRPAGVWSGLITLVAASVLSLMISALAVAGELTHDGRDRSYLLEVPDGLSGPAPVIFVLHGGTGTGQGMRQMTQLHEAGAEYGFVTVFPQGIANQWNDARQSTLIVEKQGGGGADDVGFLRALAARLVADGIADPRRIHATGLSNGGMMTFRLACEASDVFAAFVPVIANLPERAEHTCQPSRALSMMVMNGTVDRLILWNGGAVAGMFPGDRGRTLGTHRTMEIFGGLNGCDPTQQAAPVDIGFDPIVSLTVHRFTGCRNDVDLRLYAFSGMGHRWPGGFPIPERAEGLLGPAPRNFPVNQEIWSFLKDKRL